MSYQFNPFTGSFDETSSTSPGGTDTQVQFNDGGSFGGDSGLTFNKTTNALTVGGATVTTSAPVLDLSQTWNDAGVTFTGLKFNITDTASAAGSLLMDLQVGTVSQLKVDKTGVIVKRSNNSANAMDNLWLKDSSNFSIGQYAGSLITLNTSSSAAGVGAIGVSAFDIRMSSAHSLSWTSGGAWQTSADLYVTRDAANTLAQRNSTNAQTFRLYNTYTDASNYERGKFEWDTNVLKIGTEKAGSGSARALELQTDGTTRLTISTAGIASFGNALSVDTANNLFSNAAAVIAASTGGYFKGINLASDSIIAWTSGSTGLAADTFIHRDAANTLAQRNSTNAQTFRLYNTYTDASNYERGKFEWDTNVLKIGTEKAGSGSARALELQTDGTTRVTVGAAGYLGVGVSPSEPLHVSRGGTGFCARFDGGSAIGSLYTDNASVILGAAFSSPSIRTSIDINKSTETISFSLDNVTEYSFSQTAFTLADGNLIRFGGSTSSFPAIKRSTTSLQVRLADDSAFTTIESSAVNAYATYTSATNYQRCGIKTAKTTLSNVSGASVTATSLIPAGAFLIGVTSRVNTALGTGNGTTGYTVGTTGDPDLWGAITGTAEGTASGSANYTSEGACGLFTAATNVIVTAVGGNFDATGAIELAVHYLLTEAD